MHIVLFMSFIYLLRLFLGDGWSTLQGDRLCMISVQILVSSSTFDSLRSGYSQPQSQPMPSTNPEGQGSASGAGKGGSQPLRFVNFVLPSLQNSCHIRG